MMRYPLRKVCRISGHNAYQGIHPLNPGAGDDMEERTRFVFSNFVKAPCSEKIDGSALIADQVFDKVKPDPGRENCPKRVSLQGKIVLRVIHASGLIEAGCPLLD